MSDPVAADLVAKMIGMAAENRALTMGKARLQSEVERLETEVSLYRQQIDALRGEADAWRALLVQRTCTPSSDAASVH